MLFHFGRFDKRATAGKKHVGADSRWLFSGHIVLASPARKNPFRMLGEPLLRILLPAHQTSRQRQALERALFDAGAGCPLQAEDEYECGHELF